MSQITLYLVVSETFLGNNLLQRLGGQDLASVVACRIRLINPATFNLLDRRKWPSQPEHLTHRWPCWRHECRGSAMR